MAYERFLAGFELRATAQEFAALNGPPLSEVVRRLKATHAIAGDLDTLVGRYGAMVDQLYTEVPAAVGARRLLVEAARRGCAVVVVTSNSTARTLDWLARVDLAAYVDAIVCGDDVRHGKPHPQPYLLASQKVSCARERIIAVEDSVQGAHSAIQAGLKTYLIGAASAAAPVSSAVIAVSSLDHLVDLLWG